MDSLNQPGLQLRILRNCGTVFDEVNHDVKVFKDDGIPVCLLYKQRSA